MTTWNIELSFLEDTDYTQAIATLRTPDERRKELRGLGQARRNPEDRSVPAIGEEVAGARALSSLAHELLNYAADEIEKNVLRDDPLM
ncbi:hypothetical protein Rhe02_74250 [Rhizocola hellebori]|uniref:DUF1876 domain-containing protein n=1 Tax=Rhizocola hellebori TaxID=1392758 RepID=A0A8J3VKS4_9ACTN|nr:DUF1876 domain-containing protein [Rhizocola hellebori]GIH09358.1 hypothetical protein Rhe02_74250 [Rhizocola hellebori]